MHNFHGSNSYHAYESSRRGGSGGGGGGGGRGFGRGWVVIVAVVILLISFIADGADWDTIDCLLAWGFLAFLFARSLF